MKYRLLMAALVWMVAAHPYSDRVAAQSAQTCGDFLYQEDAQEYFDSGGGRPTESYFGMDQDGDGVACETLPPRPASASASVPWAWLGGGAGSVLLAAVGYLWVRSFTRAQTVVSADQTARLSTAMGQTGAPPATAMQTPVVVNVHNNADSRANSAVKAATRSAVTVMPQDIPDWKRLTPEKARAMPYDAYLRTPYWQTVRRNNIARAGGRCRDCGRSDQVLQVHHLSYEFLGREDDRYLVVLCATCHEKRHDIAPPPAPVQA